MFATRSIRFATFGALVILVVAFYLRVVFYLSRSISSLCHNALVASTLPLSNSSQNFKILVTYANDTPNFDPDKAKWTSLDVSPGIVALQPTEITKIDYNGNVWVLQCKKTPCDETTVNSISSWVVTLKTM